MIRYRFDVLQALKDRGVTTYYMNKHKVFGMADIHKMRQGIVLGMKGLDKLCELLHMQPGKIIEWIPGPEESGAESNR